VEDTVTLWSVTQMSPRGSTWNTVGRDLTEAQADARVEELLSSGYPARKVAQEARAARVERPKRDPRERQEQSFRRAVADVMRSDGRKW
jgi:hypothetical protein